MDEMKSKPPAFVCPLCKRRSYHPVDIAERYCAACGFVDDVIAELVQKGAEGFLGKKV